MLNQPIYVNEHLTKYFRELMWQAKTRKTENGEKLYKFVWFKDSKLLVRRNDTSKIERIRSNNDLYK